MRKVTMHFVGLGDEVSKEAMHGECVLSRERVVRESEWNGLVSIKKKGDMHEGYGRWPCMHGSMQVDRKWVVGENGYDYVGGYGYDGGNGYGDVEKRVVTGSWVDMHEGYEIWT